MIGVLFGGACGAAELALLKLLVDKVSAGEIPYLILPLKLLAIPLFLVPCALIARDQLHIAGISAGAVLIVGTVAIFCFRAYTNKARKSPASKADGGKSE